MANKLLNSITGRKITDSDSIKKSEAFCMKPWVHLFVSHYGSVVPCCLTPWDKDQALGDINQESIQEIWNGREMKAFRAKLLKDKKDDRCKQCYQSEKVGLKSTRQMTNALYSHKVDWVTSTKNNGYSKDAKPIFWDLRISNLCNFKCRICGHHSSSQWYSDAKVLDLISHETRLHRGPKDFDLLLKQLEFVLPDLEEIYFAGGEPLIMEEHYAILDILIEKGLTDIKLRYATNFSQTVYKGTDVFEKWKNFPNVYVHASLDDSREKGELQRNGQSWDEVLSNRKRMKELCPHVDFLITPTISVYNIFSICELHKELVTSDFCKIDEFMPHTLRIPQFLDVQILPSELKQQAKEIIENHIEWVKDWAEKHPPSQTEEQLKEFKERMGHLSLKHETPYAKLNMVLNEFANCVSYMNAGDKSALQQEFVDYNTKLDTLRNESTQETFPELKPIFTNQNSTKPA